MGDNEKTVRKIKGAHLLQPDGSLIFCDVCDKIVGSINAKGYNYIKLSFLCSCDNHGSIEITRDGHSVPLENNIRKMPVRKRLGMLCCADCDISLFSVIEERVKNYSFSAECICGRKYDMKPQSHKRFGELIELYKKEHGE